ARHGTGELFVFEADASDGSFLLIPPWAGVITNLDADHLDFYARGLEEIEDAFAEFAVRCEHVVAFGDDPSLARALARAGVRATTYGSSPGCDLQLRVDSLGPEGARGTVRVDEADIALRLRVDGAHNLLNAAAAIAVARLAGVPAAASAEAFAAFEGVHRRFEHRGDAGGAEFFDDYGQTPTEMEVTVETARRRAPRRLIALVQPHRYWRVRSLWRELGASVSQADLVVVTDVYGAAQDPIPGVTGKLVVEGVQLASPGSRTVYLPHRSDVVTFLGREVRHGDRQGIEHARVARGVPRARDSAREGISLGSSRPGSGARGCRDAAAGTRGCGAPAWAQRARVRRRHPRHARRRREDERGGA